MKIVRLFRLLFLPTIFCATNGAIGASGSISEAELVARTRELFDTAAQGDRAPWQKYFADDGMYFDEKGRDMNKAELLESIEPLPPGFSGTITLVKARSKIEGATAVLSYDLDETEVVFGQQLRARYHGTDTWMLRGGAWQIIAGQMLRYYEDPPVGRYNAANFADYAGTYQLSKDKLLNVVSENGILYVERGKGSRTQLFPESGDIFFRKGIEGRIVFHRGEDGKVDEYISRRNNEDIVWRKVSSTPINPDDPRLH